jgi:3-deoxy-manno-octulosonate cytidylyltransferase (CMP-KDO synthetase)
VKFIGIIPTRYASTRFPGKPLADLCGCPVIEHVYRQVAKALDDVWVATDDHRIADVVDRFGGKTIMTSIDHRCGTDRCCEAYENIDSDADVIINIQGDEPFIDPKHIETLMACMDADVVPDIATLAYRNGVTLDQAVLMDRNRPKVIVDGNMYALEFRRLLDENNYNARNVYQHIGIYAYRNSILGHISKLPQSIRERQESLEQYRWLDAGYKIKVGIVSYVNAIAIDTPADLDKARFYYKQMYCDDRTE